MKQSYTADYIFPISSPPIKNGVVIVGDDGIIEAVLTQEEYNDHSEFLSLNLKTYTGIICPGFINAHCHLELSHLKGKFSERRGLPFFIGEMVSGREAKKEAIEAAIANAEDEMISNGIVAVGDICNTEDTIRQKKKNRLKYHNFIELFDLHPDRAKTEFERGMQLIKEFTLLPQQYSLTPHAPYSVSQELLKQISEWALAHGRILTIHNQETVGENEMFLHRSGALFEKLSSFGPLYNDWKAPGSSSLSYILDNISEKNKLLLVHNTYTTKEDIDFIPSNVFWCFCPNANLFIENRTADFSIFINTGCKITIGTDSYASNRTLSILEELKTIHSYNTAISLNEILKWSTLNGAEFFGWDKELGSIEKGKRPGLNLISDINMETLSLTELSKIHKVL